MPVDQFLQYSLKYDFKAVIVGVWSESVDAGVILGKKSQNPEGDVTKMNDASLSISYVPGTPMEFLTNLTIDKLDLFNLSNSDTWRDKCSSPDEVLKKASNGDGDYFALWEPEASMAMSRNPDLIKIFGTGDMTGYVLSLIHI